MAREVELELGEKETKEWNRGGNRWYLKWRWHMRLLLRLSRISWDGSDFFFHSLVWNEVTMKQKHTPSQKEVPFGRKYTRSLPCKEKYCSVLIFTTTYQEDVSIQKIITVKCVWASPTMGGAVCICVCVCAEWINMWVNGVRFKIHRNNQTVLLFAYWMHMIYLHFFIQSSVSVVSTRGVSRRYNREHSMLLFTLCEHFLLYIFFVFLRLYICLSFSFSSKLNVNIWSVQKRLIGSLSRVFLCWLC